jgi:hypothetical protein
MKLRRYLIAIGCAVALSAAAAPAASVYAGLLGIGIQNTWPVGENRLSLGGKLEGGILREFGLSPQAVLRYDVPSQTAPIYLQFGLGARLKVGDEAKVQPFPSVSIGVQIDRYHLLLQLLGYPVIGLEFPVDSL